MSENFRWGTPIEETTMSRVFYVSFFSDDEEYKLYDNVYVCNSSDEPHIGKISDLWEEKSTGERKVLIRWFFRKKELATDTGDSRELFLAFGEGKGVQNENELDVICGKCRVLCTSKAAENRQPTEDDLNNANYFYSKIFDVDLHHFRPVEDVIDKLGYDVVYNKREWITSRKESNDVPQAVVSSTDRNIEIEVRQGTQFVEPPFLELKKRTIDTVVADLRGSKDEQVTFPKDSKKLQLSQPAKTFNKGRIFKELVSTRKKVVFTIFHTGIVKEIVSLQPWEERLEQGIKYGKVLLLQNLDPYMTSADVKELFKSVFQSIVDVQALPHEKSIPHGQALAIFENKRAADSAFEEMENNCLLVTADRRPIIARRVGEPAKSTRFPGHLMLNKFKHCRQLQTEDYKKAVSTSHCSQPNTIEYEMAMEWRHLHGIKRVCLEELFKKQRKELDILKNRNDKKS